jgi:hyperosmotically inducible periplasmic protein
MPIALRAAMLRLNTCHYVALLAGVTAVAACSREPAEAPDDGAYLATQTPEPRPDPALDRPDPGPAPVAQAELTPAAGSTNPTNAAAAPAPAAERTPSATVAPTAAPPDNTKRNERDRDSAALTPTDQGNGESDLKITQRIRQAVMADGSLSFNAKNVKIITVGGKVTLRGPVKSDAERAAIDAAAKNVAGAGQVDNQIEVKK